jgi:hypothetical protein
MHLLEGFACRDAARAHPRELCSSLRARFQVDQDMQMLNTSPMDLAANFLRALKEAHLARGPVSPLQTVHVEKESPRLTS